MDFITIEVLLLLVLLIVAILMLERHFNHKALFRNAEAIDRNRVLIYECTYLQKFYARMLTDEIRRDRQGRWNKDNIFKP